MRQRVNGLARRGRVLRGGRTMSEHVASRCREEAPYKVSLPVYSISLFFANLASWI